MLKFKIEHKQTLWKHRRYKVVERGKNFTIERPFEFDLNQEIKDLLRRKQKWE